MFTELARSKMAKRKNTTQDAGGRGIAQASDHSTATVNDLSRATVNVTNNYGLTAADLLAAVRAADEAHQTVIQKLSNELQATQEAVRGFLRILNESDVPPESLSQKLAEIAQRHRELLERLALLEQDNPKVKAIIEEARTILGRAGSTEDYARADRLLEQAEQIDLRAV